MTPQPTPGQRRTLHFDALGDLSAELDRLESAHAADTLRSTGNWSPGQILQHLADVHRMSFEGVGFRLALPLRVLGRLMKGRALSRGMRPGFKAPAGLAPDPDVDFDAALGNLREQISRCDRGQRMTQRSPILGPMSHEDWVRLHCRHAELHLGFLHTDTDEAEA